MSRFLAVALAVAILLPSSGCVGHAAALPDTPLNAPTADAAISPPPAPEVPDDAGETVETPETEEPYIRVIDPAKPMVALTFDDGPHETCSDQILDILEANHAVATFFEVGCNVAKYPAVVAREAALGCEIGSHSNVHKNLSKLKKDALLADLAAADAAFSAAGVPAPTLVRPPYGAVNKTVRTTTDRALITWNIDTEDWRSRSAQAVIDYVQGIENLDGDVVLMHSIYDSTVQAVQVLVPWLQEQGYQLVTVTELMAYYYGELPQPNKVYGYSYFFGNGRTDTPLTLPTAPAQEDAAAAGEQPAA